jgi:CRISPR/Cas system CSM-associated protein Csm3 (group 7 of RAMP superfamily)
MSSNQLRYQLRLTLLSDATFGRGDGVAGLVDAEVQHDAAGLPFLGGRTLKGLLGAECSDIVFALSVPAGAQVDPWRKAADRLFGVRGASLTGSAILRVGPAQLPADLRAALLADVVAERLTPGDVLDTVTALRRQTAMDAAGAPLENTLRTMRVILRGATFWANLDFLAAPSELETALLAASVKALRRAGTGRNRGRGRLAAALFDGDKDVTDELFCPFKRAVAQ